MITEKENGTGFNIDDRKTSALDKTTRKLESSVYKNVELVLKNMMDITKTYPDCTLWEFSLSGFRKFLYLNKGKEAEIKESFRKIGVHADEKRTKFECRVSLKQIHAIRYHISVGDLRSIYDPFYEKLELSTEVKL